MRATGNKSDAALSFAGAIPIYGWFATGGGKWVKNGLEVDRCRYWYRNDNGMKMTKNGALEAGSKWLGDKPIPVDNGVWVDNLEKPTKQFRITDRT